MTGKIVSIDPTLFVKEVGGAPGRVVRVEIELDSPSTCTLSVAGPDFDEIVNLGTAQPG